LKSECKVGNNLLHKNDILDYNLLSSASVEILLEHMAHHKIVFIPVVMPQRRHVEALLPIASIDLVL
jgi:hypothetical protein